MSKHLSPMNKMIVQSGSVAAIGRDLGVTKQAVQYWFRRGYVPTSYAAKAARFYDLPVESLIDPRLLEDE